MGRSTRACALRRVCVAAVAVIALLAPPAPAVPVLGTETPRGAGEAKRLPARGPATKRVDGRIGDWRGRGAGFAGVTIRSVGELIYTDHLFDVFGADDGRDAERLATMKPVEDGVPEAYRLNAVLEHDPAGQFDAPTPEEVEYHTNYGDLERSDRLDLTELRVAAGRRRIHVLARTARMDAASDAALLVLLDTRPGDERRTVPFGSGLTTERADLAVLLSGTEGHVADLRTGRASALPAGSVATRPDGWTNAIEASIPRAGIPRRVAVAAATGRPTPSGDGLADLGTGPELANVAFRHAEPVRTWFERQQALALQRGSVDGFFARVDLRSLRRGVTERYVPGPGYHERIFRSSRAISREEGQEGIRQHYGVYLPRERSRPAPLQLWLHWRGGAAHSAGHAIPGMFEDLGERHDTIVVSPRGRGTSGWYVGRSHVDVEEVWADVHDRFDIDPARRYVAGHSMGGWGSVLMTTTHPDWFAAALPASPPVTQGAWTGIDFAGCDELAADEYTPCYIAANGGRPRDQHTRRLLENLRHVPVAIYHGLADELVPYAGVARQVERLVQLGYRHRFYTFPVQEHHGPPVWDEWEEGGRYLHRFTRPSTPAEVSFVRDMPFERAVEEVNSGDVDLDFDFDSAYWMAGLEPVDHRAGRATFEGRSLALPLPPTTLAPEAGGPASPGQTGPWAMTGLRWIEGTLRRLPDTANGFEAKLTGARAVTLDGERMRLDPSRPVRAVVETGAPLELTLLGGFRPATAVRVAGRRAVAEHRRGALTVRLAPGRHTLVVRPSGGRSRRRH